MRKLTLILAALMANFAKCAANIPNDSILERYAAKMLMVGFRGDSVTSDHDAILYVRDLRVGGLILFDVDLTGSKTIGSRNITSKSRLKTMVSEIRKNDEGGELLIAIDQEGGRVCRLKTEYGFPPTVSAEEIGRRNDDNYTSQCAKSIASELAECGINLNLAPDVDILNPECPVIGKLHRSFSQNVDTITHCASIFIDEHRKLGVACAVKHFPGHGSSMSDSHYGLTDITATWNKDELIPFISLNSANRLQAIMTAHVFNRKIDKHNPITLSKKAITGLLRKKIGFEGVVITDDMYMQGITDNYSIEDAIVMTINAGADMLIVGNNIATGYESERPFRLVKIIVNAVKSGKIPFKRLAEANKRISELTKSLKGNQ